jgi:hypothetical protein
MFMYYKRRFETRNVLSLLIKEKNEPKKIIIRSNIKN